MQPEKAAFYLVFWYKGGMANQCPRCPLKFTNRFEVSDHLRRDHSATQEMIDALQPAHIRFGLLKARRAQKHGTLNQQNDPHKEAFNRYNKETANPMASYGAAIKGEQKKRQSDLRDPAFRVKSRPKSGSTWSFVTNFFDPQ